MLHSQDLDSQFVEDELLKVMHSCKKTKTNLKNNTLISIQTQAMRGPQKELLSQ